MTFASLAWTATQNRSSSQNCDSGRVPGRCSQSAPITPFGQPRTWTLSLGTSARSYADLAMKRRYSTLHLCMTHLRQFEPENGERNADFLMFSWVRIHAPAKCSVTKAP